MNKLALILAIACAAGAQAAPREVIPLPTWAFAEEREPHTQPNQDWQPVTVPHLFRQSGLPDDTAGWYRCSIPPAAADVDRCVALKLEGAASVKEVFVNGTSVGQHRGAFSAAVFDLTPAWKTNVPNEIAIRVSNRDAESQGCLSRSPLYYVNGGLFRPVSLVKTSAVHIFPESGSSGVYLTPTADALGVRAIVRNASPDPVAASLRVTVRDPAGAVCTSFVSPAEKIDAGTNVTLSATGKVAHPQPWDLGKPNLYQVRAEVLLGDEVVDEISERTGFRTIATRDGSFYLNDREVQFRGVNNHEQTEENWNIESPAEARREFEVLADLGVNTVRLAHYPHSDWEYDLADEQGLAVWAENGFAGQMWQPGASAEEKRPTPDGERLTCEMVRQLWNHPGILFWSAGNETVVETVERYADVIRAEDKTRLITYAANGGEPRNCDFVARNNYAGWYGGQLAEFRDRPGHALISETGAGSVATQHVPYGTASWKVNQFEPEEYAEIFTEAHLQTVCRDDIAGRPMFLWWLFRDFYDHKFKDRLNTKGLLQIGGTPKDGYYLFQAFLRPDHPVIHLCGTNHFLRNFAPDNGIKVYSNAPALTLLLNGKSQGELRNGSYQLPDGFAVANVFFWKTPLQPGRNVVEVRDATGRKEVQSIYQKAPDGTVPLEPDALISHHQSSNPNNPAVWIDSPILPGAPVYYDGDGSSDNTFADQLPTGARRLATRRLSDPAHQTDISFQLRRNATVHVMFSTGTYPRTTLHSPNPAIEQAAAAMKATLTAAGFIPQPLLRWHDHELNFADAALWSRRAIAGEPIKIPGQLLDYVILLAPAESD